MSLNEVDPAANRSTANGSTTVFPYTFMIYANTDIEVLVDTTVKTITTDYTVDGLGVSGGGNVTFIAAPANAAIVTLLRKQAAAQASDYQANEAFPSVRIEKDYDKIVMAIQQAREVLRRCLTFKKSSSQSAQTIDEPTEGLFARWKTGGGIDWATPTNATLSLPVSIANGGTGAITAALARTALSVPTLAEAGVQADNVFRITGSADASKKVAFEVDGLTTATTRTWTVPDVDDTIVGLAAPQIMTTKTLTSPVLNTGVSGTALAVQSDQETGTSTTKLVTTGMQQFHPCAAKAWAIADYAGALSASYNISSVTDGGTGVQTFNFIVAFSSANYSTVATAQLDAVGSAGTTVIAQIHNAAKTTSACRVDTLVASTFGWADASKMNFAAYGDQ